MVQADVEQFVTELDAAVQAHMEWTRRLLRCGILRETPADDVLQRDAHRLCHFGRWFMSRRPIFAGLDDKRVVALETAHRCMHDATRVLCQCLLEGRPGERADLDKFEHNQSALIEHLAHFKTLALARSSHVDALTELPMSHGIAHDFDLLRQQVGRQSHALLVALIDIDHFKRINDEHGHAAGDIVLRRVASVLRETLRTQDQLYRYGGEEFLLLVPLNESDHAVMVADRLLDIIRGLEVVVPGGAVIQPRVTIGAAVTQLGEDMAEVIRRACAALYEAKAAGHDGFVISGALPTDATPDLPVADDQSYTV